MTIDNPYGICVDCGAPATGTAGMDGYCDACGPKHNATATGTRTTKSACCFVAPGEDGSGYDCTAIPTWGFRDGGEDPYRVNYACDDHLGHVIADVVDGITVWPLVDGYDPRLYRAEDIEVARSAKKDPADG